MREYTIIRPGSPGVVADDETIMEEIRLLRNGRFTLIVEDDDPDGFDAAITAATDAIQTEEFFNR